MRKTWILAAACALAACGSAERAEDARAAAPPAGPAADSLPARGDAPVAGNAAGDTAYAFRLHETRPGTVDSITVTRGGRAVQTLRPSENQVPPETEVPRISRIDLDFDGYGDLGFVTELTMASSMSEYWRLDPATGRFVPAGVHHTLHPDSGAREHATHVRGGYAGRLWTASRWRWIDGALAEVRREEQDVAEEGEAFVHIIHERLGGVLKETSRDTLAGAEVRSGPTWVKP